MTGSSSAENHACLELDADWPLYIVHTSFTPYLMWSPTSLVASGAVSEPSYIDRNEMSVRQSVRRADPCRPVAPFIAARL